MNEDTNEQTDKEYVILDIPNDTEVLYWEKKSKCLASKKPVSDYQGAGMG